MRKILILYSDIGVTFNKQHFYYAQLMLLTIAAAGSH